VTNPIPLAALDDRLGFVGTAGSGKTYGAGTAVERLLAHGSRVVIPDPLGVWWGLRLVFDGKTASPFDVVIFGGPHGDLPITEHAGALIGETVAGMKESAIVDLSALGTKAAERRFMLAFLTALYRKATKDPVHVVFDEADLWAPQQIRDRDQEPAKLLGMMETIVRRGRVAGFVPWLITQRPAVVNKDVLSQVDGLIAFKLTSSQDRKALGAWIEGQADRDEGKRILGTLPQKQVGEAVVWIPARGILADAKFPEKATYDSSRTPKRGEKRTAAELKPLDLGALKERLSTVEAETKANDPKALKAEVARLQRELAAAQKSAPGDKKLSPPPAADVLKAAREDGARAGFVKGYTAGAGDEWQRGASAVRAELEVLAGDAASIQRRLAALVKAIDAISRKPTTTVSADALAAFDPAKLTYKSTRGAAPALPKTGQSIGGKTEVLGQRPIAASRVAQPRPTNGDGTAGGTTLGLGERRVLVAIAQTGSAGITREGLTVMTGYKRSSRNTYLQRLSAAGLIEAGTYKIFALQPGLDLLGPDFEPLPTGEALIQHWLRELPEGERKLFEQIVAAFPEPVDRTIIGDRAGYKRSSTNTYIQRLAARDLVVPTSAGVVASETLFQ
jgi:hypothetical protein